jgi:hypothetical protein
LGKSIEILDVVHPVPSGDIVKGKSVAVAKVSPAIGIVQEIVSQELSPSDPLQFA